jgi:hypothetical protein
MTAEQTLWNGFGDKNPHQQLLYETFICTDNRWFLQWEVPTEDEMDNAPLEENEEVQSKKKITMHQHRNQKMTMHESLTILKTLSLHQTNKNLINIDSQQLERELQTWRGFMTHMQ